MFAKNIEEEKEWLSEWSDFFLPTNSNFWSCHPGFMIYAPCFEKKSKKFYMLSEVLVLVFLNCIMLLTFYRVDSSRSCVRHVLTTSSDVGQCRLQWVSTLDRLKVCRLKFVFSCLEAIDSAHCSDALWMEVSESVHLWFR